MIDQADLRRMTAAGRAITDAVGKSFEAWAEGETATIAKLWLSAVPSANEERAVMRGRSRTAGEVGVQRGKVTINTGRKGGQPGKIWFGKKSIAGRVSDSGTIVWSHRHYTNEDWTKFSEMVKQYAQQMPKAVAAGKAAVGLARNSIVQIADALGYALETVRGGSISASDIAKARAARASDGKEYVNGEGIREKTADSFSLEMINRYPRIRESHIDTALSEVVSNRLSLASTVLGGSSAAALQRVARTYPFLEIAA